MRDFNKRRERCSDSYVNLVCEVQGRLVKSGKGLTPVLLLASSIIAFPS